MSYQDFEAFLNSFLECDLSSSQLPKQMYKALQRCRSSSAISRQNSISPDVSHRFVIMSIQILNSNQVIQFLLQYAIDTINELI